MSDFNVDETKKILEDIAAQEKDLSKTMAEMIQTIEEKGHNEKENESFNLIVGLNESEIRVLKMIQEKIEETFKVNFDKLRAIEGKSVSSENTIQKISRDITQLEAMIEDKIKTIRSDQNYQQIFSKFEQQYEALKERARGHSEDLSKLKKQSNKLLEVLNTESEKFTKDDIDALKNALNDLNHTANSLSKKDEMVQFEENIMSELEQTKGSISSVLRDVESNFGTINTNLEKIPERLRENNANFESVFSELKNDQEHQKDLLKTLKQETSKILSAQKEVSPELLEVLTETIKPVLEQNKKNENENRELLKVLKEDFYDLKEKQLESQDAYVIL